MLKVPVLILAAVSGAMAVSAFACGDTAPAAPDTTPSASTTASTKPTATVTATSPTGPDATVPDTGVDADTGPRTPVRFVALGDQGKGCTATDAAPTDGQCKVAAAMEAKCAKDGCDFGLLLGDNIYPSGATSPTDPIFQKIFEEPYKNLDIPFYVALGNHDYGNDGAGTTFAVGQNEVDYTQHSKKWKLPAKHYHQVFGGGTLELFVGDTNSAMVGNSALVGDGKLFGAQDALQRTDLKAWMKASTATWKIAMGHHPYLSNGTHGNAGCYDPPGGLCILPAPFNGGGVKNFLEDAVCGRVDFYLSGHDHSRQWLTDKCNGTELIVSGGGATTTAINTKNPTQFQKEATGFLYVVIDGKKLTGEFLDDAGNVEYTRTVTKP
ncbi:MAG: metallophosphoesterase [Myxococcales bacterium]|nr:metallophosphoesterase [Myxococcales bacterium]